MKQSKIITWQGADLCCKELTLEELASVLDNIGKTADALDLVFPERLPSEAVVVSSGLMREDLHKIAPSVLAALWQAVEDVNPFFLSAVRRMLGLSGQEKS